MSLSGAWWTTPGRVQPPVVGGGARIAPGLLFHKWQCYDRLERGGRPFQVKNTRVPWLRKVARAVDASVAAHGRRWQDDYLQALSNLGARTIRATTVSRLAAGLATNPALENGLHLHPLYGFPILPGSAVKGLVHSVAEQELIGDERFADGSFVDDVERAGAFLETAARIWRLFGSLSLRPIEPTPDAEPPAVPAEAVERVRRQEAFPEELRRRAAVLLDEARIARARFYDAFPAMDGGAPRQLLEPDILNPHYPEFYDSGNRHEAGSKEPVVVPSDDQDPRPVYFLTVRAKVEFVFPWRYVEVPEPEGAAEPEKARDLELTERWLTTGLKEWGLGGKTAAGYGYFQLGGGEAGARTTESAAAAREPEAQAEWTGVMVRYQANQQRLEIDHAGRTAWAPGKDLAQGLSEALRNRLLNPRKRSVTCNARVAWQPEGYYRIEELSDPSS